MSERRFVDEPPDGFHYEWRVDPDWTTDPDVLKNHRCRMLQRGYVTCPNRAVAALRRMHHHGNANVGRWWRYCEEHLYGRLLIDGEVQQRVLVPDDEAAS